MNVVSPEAENALQLWQQSVELGRCGYYRRARGQLAALAKHASQRSSHDVGYAIVHSLVLSTSGSLIRQQGNHRASAPLDGRALALAQRVTHVENGWAYQAYSDAIIGLAADYIGLEQPHISSRLLSRHDATFASDDPRLELRCRVRAQWVAAETAFSQARWQDAQEPIALAVDLSRSLPAYSIVKTDLIAATGRLGTSTAEASALAADVLGASLEHNFLPLAWAALQVARCDENFESGSWMADNHQRSFTALPQEDGVFCDLNSWIVHTVRARGGYFPQ